MQAGFSRPAFSRAGQRHSISDFGTGLILVAAIFLLREIPASAADTPAAPATKHTLKYQFRNDEILRYEQNQTSDLESRYEDVTETVVNRSDVRKHYRVIKVHPEGGADIELVIDSVMMRAKVGENPEEVFDSQSKEEVDRPDFRRIQELIGKPQAVLRFSPQGKLLEVIKTADKLPEQSKDDFQSLLATLPEQPVAIGETWKEDFKIRVTVDQKLTQEVALRRTYKLESVEGSRAKISLRTAVLTPSRTPAIEVQLSQREVHGTIVFDMTRGVILDRNVEASRKVINAFGVKTEFQAKMHNTEKLQEGTPPPAATATPPASTPPAKP